MKYRFVKDDDGHSYLIPAELTQEFYRELFRDIFDVAYKFDVMFDKYRCDSITNYTFENPLID
jgi:hypothetical protein